MNSTIFSFHMMAIHCIDQADATMQEMKRYVSECKSAINQSVMQRYNNQFDYWFNKSVSARQMMEHLTAQH